MFVPLIISSSGNSGSQATTLVIRAMGALRGNARRRDGARDLLHGRKRHPAGNPAVDAARTLAA
ncbi:MAG TPA: hypothetical protein VGP93_02310 [Polyangiaceae bacterium]|nr:hypothetical protein [Polyangiaceae bacterium]